MWFCGFESGDSSEYTSATGISFSETGPYGGYCATLAGTTGTVSWSIPNMASNAASINACNLLLGKYAHGTPLKVKKGGVYYYATVNTPVPGIARRTFALYTPSYSKSATLDNLTGWVSVAIVIAVGKTQLYVNGTLLCEIAEGSSEYAGVTEVSAFGGAYPITVDDFVLYFGTYNPKTVAFVMPWVPSLQGDKDIELSGYPVGGYNSTKVDEYTTDDDTTYVYTPSDNTYEDFYECIPYSSTLGLSIVGIYGLKTHVRCRYSTSGGTKDVYPGIRAGMNDTAKYVSAHDAPSSYTMYHDYFRYANAGAFQPEWFTNAGVEPTLLLALKCVVATGRVRVTKFRASVFVFLSRESKPTDIHLTGGFDVSMTLDTSSWPDAEHYVRLITNVEGTPLEIPLTEETTGDICVEIRKKYDTSWEWFVSAGIWDNTDSYLRYTEMYKIADLTPKEFDIRLVMHEGYLSIFRAGAWKHTFSFPTVTYPAAIDLDLKASYATPVNDIRVVELCDWREAVFIDMATTAGSGLGSVIQERPVELNPVCGGMLDFSYNRIRDSVSLGHVIEHVQNEATATMAGSHFIIYYRDVAVHEDEAFMDSDGYLTKVLQLSWLDTGAIDLASILAQRGRELQETHAIRSAPDPRIEPGDKATIGYTIASTGRNVSTSIIVESVTIEMRDGNYMMTTEGRHYV